MRPALLLLLALVAALVAGTAAQTSCGLKLSAKDTTRAAKSRRSRQGREVKVALKYHIKNRSGQDLVDVAFEVRGWVGCVDTCVGGWGGWGGRGVCVCGWVDTCMGACLRKT